VKAALAVLLAIVTSALYAFATSVQALEARVTPRETALRASLLARLVRRRVWLAGTAAGLVAWPVQAAALSLGSVALVQPALGFGLVVLLLLGVGFLGEHVGPREVAGVALVIGAVAILGFAAPAETGEFTSVGRWVVGIGAAVIAPAPYLLRRLGLDGGLATSLAAGLGWAWVGLATSLVDVSLADRRWLVAVGWAAAVGVMSFGALLAEMTSLQTWPATRAIPVSFGIEMLLPAILAPALTRGSPPHPVAFAVALGVACVAAVLLGSSPAVAKAAAGEVVSDTVPGV
jgi:drug/metabolite transporter (DMT)-like permease